MPNDACYTKALENALRPAGTLRPRARFGDRSVIDFTAEDLEAEVALNGFGAREEGGRWTVGPRAGFVFEESPEGLRGAVLAMEFVPCTQSGEPRTLAVCGGGGEWHEFTFPAGPMSAERVVVPMPPSAAGVARRIQLRVSSDGSPLAPGLLGVRLSRVRLNVLREIKIGDAVDFTGDLEGMVALAGFDIAEPHGRWSRERSAAGILRVSRLGDAAAVAEIELTPLVTPNRGQRLRLRDAAGGARELWFAPGQARTQHVCVPLAPVGMGTLRRFQLEFPDATSCEALGMGEDRRSLAVQVRALRVYKQGVRQRLAARWRWQRDRARGAKRS